MAVAAIRVGDLVLGRYKVERELGSGGMAQVYAAVHVQLEQRVALKFLTLDPGHDGELGERFVREARIAAKLQSQHAARVLDIGTVDDETHCIVMEYLEGEDLAQTLERSGPLEIEHAIGYILDACEALAEAHALGVIHRDLKPSNIFLATRPDGSVQLKIIDFGVACIVDAKAAAPEPALTKTRALLGTPSYMSPEQLQNARDVDARTDIWALGVTLYELLAGERPFEDGPVPVVCAAILKDEPAPLQRVVPSALASAIARCLVKNRDLRFQNIAELAEALLPFGPPRAAEALERIRCLLARTPAAPAVEASDRSSESRAPTEPDRASEDPTKSAVRDGASSEQRLRFAALAGLLADTSKIPRLAVSQDALKELDLEPRTAFLLSRMDGVCSLQEILDVAGMEAGDALEILSRLFADGIATI
jgi:eukaryotic-like serine/threonine-protein kinase